MKEIIKLKFNINEILPSGKIHESEKSPLPKKDRTKIKKDLINQKKYENNNLL